MLWLNTLPVPNNSLVLPKTVSAKVKPSPIPRPSKPDEIILFLEANDSALARTIQLTTIRGINRPKDEYSEGKYAFINISRIETNAAITTM